MTLNPVFLLTTFLLIGACYSLAVDGGSLKVVGKSQSSEEDELKVQFDTPSTPENLHIIDNEDALQVSINNEEANSLLNDILLEGDESSRSAKSGLDEESLSGLSRERLLSLLDKSDEDFVTKLPTNREFIGLLNDTQFNQNITNDGFNSSLRGYYGNSKCIRKVMLVEETQYERSMKCHHTLKEKCHTTYITDYTSTPEEKCDTTFQKNCHITFKPVPHTETFEKCHTPLLQKCGDDIVGPKVCKTEYEDHCETTYKKYTLHQEVPECELKEETRCKLVPINLLNLPDHEFLNSSNYAKKEICEKWPVKRCSIKAEDVTKTRPETQCRKIPKEICSNSNCIMVPGDKICNEETRTVVQNVPEEDCDLEPQRKCSTESTLVPKLIPKKNCVKVPKDICVNIKSNPKIVKKPIVKNWCYNPRDYYNNLLN